MASFQKRQNLPPLLVGQSDFYHSNRLTDKTQISKEPGGQTPIHSQTEYTKRVKNRKVVKMPALKDKSSAEKTAAVVKFVRTGFQKDVLPAQHTKHHQRNGETNWQKKYENDGAS